MHGNSMRGLLRFLALICVALLPSLALSADTGSAEQQARRQLDQPLNNAPMWRDVRRGELNPYQTTQVRGVETNVLVQSEGLVWRDIRNGPVTLYSSWLLATVAALIAIYYLIMGPLKLREQPTGRMMKRFSSWERFVHWVTAVSFIVLALTGIVTLFGKYLLLPTLGPESFSWLALVAKNVHNFVGPLFAACTILMFVTFVKDNVPRLHDWIWVARLGGLFGKRAHVPSGRFNFGEKSWFWLCVTCLGIVMAVTGFMMDFPNFGQGRGAMQFANVIHGCGAALFVAFALGHIYVGTIGIEGAYATMRTGMADETWAKEHHEYWYDEMKAKESEAPEGVASGVPASALKEG